jgi:uncharacterized membrane protein
MNNYLRLQTKTINPNAAWFKSGSFTTTKVIEMKSDKWIGGLIFIISAIMYYNSSRLHKPLFSSDSLGADFFPKLVFASLGLLGIILSVSAINVEKRQRVNAQEGEAVGGKGKHTSPSLSTFLEQYRSVLITIVSFIAYIVMMFYLGYIVSTLIFLPALMLFLGPGTRKSYKHIIAITLGGSLGIYFLFEKMIKIFLPAGIFF